MPEASDKEPGINPIKPSDKDLEYQLNVAYTLIVIGFHLSMFKPLPGRLAGTIQQSRILEERMLRGSKT